MMINTAVETQATTNVANYEKLAEVVDQFLIDIKHIDTAQHKALFGIGNENVRRNLERLMDLGANVVIRMPLVRGYNDSYDASLVRLTMQWNSQNAVIFSASIFFLITNLDVISTKIGDDLSNKSRSKYTPEELDSLKPSLRNLISISVLSVIK